MLSQSVMHYAPKVIGHVKGGVVFHYSKVFTGPAEDILPQNSNKLVPVQTCVLMPEAQGMSQLVQCIASGATIGVEVEDNKLTPTTISTDNFRLTRTANKIMDVCKLHRDTGIHMIEPI